MVRLQSTSADEFELIPEGEVVNTILDKVEPRQFTWNKETVDKLRWHFRVTDQGQWNDKMIWGDTSTAFTNHPNCRAYNWVAAITGKKYQDGEGLETDDIVGMPARVIVAHSDPDQQGRTWMRVRDVLPARQGQAVPDQEAPF